MITHRVQVGERLSEIALAYGVRTIDVVAANPHKEAILAPGVGAVFVGLEEGELLSVPAGVGDGDEGGGGSPDPTPPPPCRYPECRVKISMGGGVHVTTVSTPRGSAILQGAWTVADVNALISRGGLRLDQMGAGSGASRPPMAGTRVEGVEASMSGNALSVRIPGRLGGYGEKWCETICKYDMSTKPPTPQGCSSICN